MVTESTPMVKRTHSEQYRLNMEPIGRAQSPTAEKVSSAADAMLKLSTSAPNLPVFVVNPEAVGMGSGLPTFGQPPVAYMAQKHDGASVRRSSTSSSMEGEQLDVKPDINGLSLKMGGSRIVRKQREFIPEFKKDDHYWTKRRKNNEAAKRSREKRRMNDMALTGTITEVQQENDKLRRELRAIKKNFGLPVDQTFPYDTSEQVVVQSTSDSSDNTCSPRHIMPMMMDTNSSGPVFPSQISASPLQEALSQTLAKEAAPASPGAPKQIHAFSVSQTNPSPAIPFLIPVSSSNPQQPLALVTQLPTMTMPLNPAIVASLTLPPGMLTNQSSLPTSLTNGHDTDGGTHHYHNTNKSAAASTDSCSDVYMDKGVAPEAGQGAAAPFNNNNNNNPNHHQHSKQHLATETTSQSPDNSPTGSLRIITSSGSDFSEEGDMAEGHYPRGINPLNLCKREKDDGPLPAYIEIKPCPLTPPINEKSSIPHKLRHKLAQHLRERVAFSMYPDEQMVSANEQLGGSEADSSMNCGLQVKQEDSSSGSDGTGSPSNRSIGRGNTSIDPKYIERRKRNNQAARKCRENRRAITDMRLAKSNVLETENQRLKEELQNLTSEVLTLKDLIELKNVAKAKGEPFEPPPMKKHKDSSSSPSSPLPTKSQTDSAASPK